MWRLRKADEGHQAKQERRRGDNGHHQEELHDFVVIEPAVETAVHVRSIVISLWRFPYPSAVEFFARVKLPAHRYFGSAVSAAAISSAIRNACAPPRCAIHAAPLHLRRNARSLRQRPPTSPIAWSM